VLTISPRKEFGAAKGHVVCELQRLQFGSPEGVRLARELWEILRRKKGCTLHRLYRAARDESRWFNYSEWQSLAELAGARREAARSPLNRRLHAMLTSSSERAYEPFGAVHSIQGINFAAGPAALLIDFLEEMEEPEAALGFLAEAAGHLSHVLMHEVGKPRSLACFAHFDTLHHAEEVAHTLAEEPKLQDFRPVAELYIL
jgi:quinol monooxygenase YgiN